MLPAPRRPPVICATCRFENPPGARFCAGCGQPLTAFCASCGQQLVPGGKFCASCGTPVTGAPAAPAGAATGEVPPEAPAAERRLVTILFADIVGSTSLGEALDA